MDILEDVHREKARTSVKRTLFNTGKKRITASAQN
jgi:hypothetical protein